MAKKAKKATARPRGRPLTPAGASRMLRRARHFVLRNWPSFRFAPPLPDYTGDPLALAARDLRICESRAAAESRGLPWAI